LKGSQKEAYQVLRDWAKENSLEFPFSLPGAISASIPPKTFRLDSMEKQKYDFGAFDSNVNPVQVIVSETGDVVAIGSESDMARLTAYHTKIAKLNSILNQKKTLKKRRINPSLGKILVYTPKKTRKKQIQISDRTLDSNNRKILKKIRSLWRKIKNVINSAQNLLVNMILRNYKIVLLPHAQVISWISSTKINPLSKESKKLLMSQSLNTFESMVIRKMELMSVRLLKEGFVFGYIRADDKNSTKYCSGCQQYNHTLKKKSRKFTCPGLNPECPIVKEFEGKIHRDTNPGVNLLLWNCVVTKHKLFGPSSATQLKTIELSEMDRLITVLEEENAIFYGECFENDSNDLDMFLQCLDDEENELKHKNVWGPHIHKKPLNNSTPQFESRPIILPLSAKSRSQTGLKLPGQANTNLPIVTRTKTKDFESSSINEPIRISGLMNLGNSCYMNSTLQFLSATKPFAQYFLDGSYKHHIAQDNPLGSKGKVAEAFASLIQTIWSGEKTVVDPSSFKKCIGQFCLLSSSGALSSILFHFVFQLLILAIMVWALVVESLMS
jgi:hypothetical protein